MNKIYLLLLTVGLSLASIKDYAQPDSIVLKDINWDKNARAGMFELSIPSEGSQIAGLLYTANGTQNHPTLIMLHGYPGNERNLDIAQVVRANGWNVVFFDYRGSWGSGGQFSFANCVQDVVNVVAYCKRNAAIYRIDTSNMVLFGHSMGGWVCLKALQRLPEIKKGFALSTWNIGADFKNAKTDQQIQAIIKQEGKYFVLNTPSDQIFKPVLVDPVFYDLQNDSMALSSKKIIMLDEHHGNKELAAAIQYNNNGYFEYGVWDTDHPFSNKRISLINKVVAFLKMK